MAKRKIDEPNPTPDDQPGATPDKSASPPEQTAGPAEGLTTVESPALVPPQSEQAASETPAVSVPAPERSVTPVVSADISETTVPPADTPKFEAVPSAPSISSPPPVMPTSEIRVDAVRPGEPIASAAVAVASDVASRWADAQRFMPLAATIAIAAVVGATAGSFVTAGMGRMWASPRPAPIADTRHLRDSIARLNSELAALKASIETSSKTASTQFIKLTDRFDRFERSQIEPTLKLAKLTESVERMERRAPANTTTNTAATTRDTTGSIAGAQPQPSIGDQFRPAAVPVLEGWVVRSVFNGAALIQGRYGNIMEVEPGDTLPGLGRIETIRRQDGRWVVMTSRGMIVAR